MDNVKVALRIRPLVNSEIEIGCRTCIERIPKEPQIAIGKGQQMYTFNYVFDESEGQGKVYDEAVKMLIDNLFKGYNVTILAYGQTGSGKTYTMGTNYSEEEELGIIPRAVYDIFDRINKDLENEFHVNVSFVELYNESLFDLLTKQPREQSIVEMREISSGVCIPGLTESLVNSPLETLQKLKEGSIGRVVGATAMNAQSSRSHAIFTINIRIIPKGKEGNVVNAKFHLVDLAGSERSKKTGTTGDRFKEGVNINKGLLVLGNVISQLCDGNHSYINYRDSKLTRLLQDSLGGNSVTLMIACVSPADYNQEETISTLRYADRARKIKNKPIVNQDPQLAEISRLRKENEELRLKLISGGISQCPPLHALLQEKLTEAMQNINKLSTALGEALSHNSNMFEKTLLIENAEFAFKEKLNELIVLLSQAMAITEDVPLWRDIKSKIVEVQDEQKRLEKEILNLDKNNGKQNGVKDEYVEGDMQDDFIANQRREHILFQAEINKEILTLSENLMWKEELVAKLAENNGHLGQMQSVSAESVAELKQQLVELQQEKEELLRQIKSGSHHAQNASAKVAEARRKRLQELEVKVASLMKKVSDQERIIKLKEKSEEKIKKLKLEIMTMKQMKVKLIQQLKSENDKFKTFKAQKDREVCQLKNQNMKKQNELKRMEQMHFKQQSVLRRKLEAAAAANKRIMAALEKQRAARDKKAKGSSAEKIKEKLTEELEILESEYQAQKSLDSLLQDRAALTRELSVIKTSLNDENISDEEKIKLKTDAELIEQELELRSVEISDLQQKLIDIHQDENNKSNWDVLQSMAEAKFALNHLFYVASEKIKDNLNKSSLLAELMEQQAETDQQLEDYKNKLIEQEKYYKKALDRMEKECEEKVTVFMKLTLENSETKEGDMSETLKIQMKELEKLETFRERIEKLEVENSRLLTNNRECSKNLKNLLRRALKTNIFFHVEERGLEKLNTTFTLDSPLYTLDKFAISDPCQDPDWREDTPVYKRLHALKQKLRKRNSPMQENSGCENDCKYVQSFSLFNENCSCDDHNCESSSKRPRSLVRFDFDQEEPESAD